MKGIIGRKIGMTRIFNEKGDAVPVTVIQAGPCPVIEVKTQDTHGYDAIQIGFGLRKQNRTTKPLMGHFRKVGIEPTRILKEVRVDDPAVYEVDTFKVGDRVRVTGVSKGKGFQGVVKRWGFRGGGDAHGSKSHRKPGSIGQCATPAKVWKNRKMPGHTGNRRITVRNLEIVRIDADKNVIAVKGAVPGHPKCYVLVREQV
jgi:large subunit ribosomal protein L3